MKINDYILYLQRYIVSFVDCHLYCAAVDDNVLGQLYLIKFK